MKFDAFSDQAFECLVQALCAKTLGPGTVIFGSGPDGAREATFEGEVPFPSSTDRWKGYIVVQAKCREKLRNNQEDANWLCAQLTKDLKKFEDKKRALRKPDYFLLASNVSLSAVSKSGGKAKVEAVLQRLSKKIGLKGFAVWSADELRTLLDNAEDIRRSYTAWITPNEVLADLVSRLARPNLTKLLPLSLARDLRDERDVRLKDAGQETDKAIFLEQVFIDLPLIETGRSARAVSMPQVEAANDTLNIVAKIVQRAADKLDPLSIDLTRRDGNPLPNRLVILGGPGQGKSTLSQFLVQFQRARLLTTQKRSSLTPQTRDLLSPILARASVEQLSVDGPLRFPIRVNLPDFADAIEKGNEGSVTLLSFVADRLSREIDVTITADDLRQWLGTCPSLLVLDGLDEVPPTANRPKLIASIENFWDDLHLVNADALVVVTTRPQGYNHDLDPTYWTHWELAPLTIPYAVRFASRLCEVRVSDNALRADLVKQIGVAAAEESTKALISSPLQVAIMFGIILLKGAVPKDRWDLFDRYYSLMRDREAQKPASIVRDFKREIDVLHQEVGFLLHVSAEEAGRSAAYVTEDQLAIIIERTLIKEEFSQVDVKRISSDLSRAATHRLVFLNARVADQITFDVRSLQEFMAASQITSASPAYLVERLRAISTSAHWRNVFRIAASKIFSVADFGHYRSDVVGICHALDSGEHGEQYRLVRAGAGLALELLTDGVAASTPRFKKGLLRRAFSSLDVSQNAVSRRLIEQLTEENIELVTEEIEGRLQQGKTAASDGALKFLFEALSRDPIWAERLVTQYWPDDPIDLLDILSDVNLSYATDTIVELIKKAQWRAGPKASLQFLRRLGPLKPDELRIQEDGNLKISILPVGYQVFQANRDETELLPVVVIPGVDGQQGFSTRLRSTLSTIDFDLDDDSRQNSEWAPLEAAARFCREPSKDTLASLFDHFPSDECNEFTRFMPWIVSAVLQLELNKVTFQEMAALVRNGSFGDIMDWVAAEDRWSREGLTGDDFLLLNEPFLFGSGIAHRGAPHLMFLWLSHRDLNEERLNDLCNSIEKIADPARQAQLLRAALFVLHSEHADKYDRLLKLLNLGVQLLEVLSEKEAFALAMILLDSRCAPFEQTPFLEYLDRIGRDQGIEPLRNNISRKENGSPRLLNAVKENPKHRGLLVHLAKFVMQDWRAHELKQIDVKLLDVLNEDNSNVRAAIDILRIASSLWGIEDIPRIAEVLQRVSLTHAEYSYLLSFVGKHEHGLALLIKLEQEGGRDKRFERNTRSAVLRRLADSNPSRLSDAWEQKRLDLPSPP